MKHEKIDALEVCKEFEDVLAPRLKLSVLDRAVYSHLLRHSRFEGKSRLRFSILWLANNMGVRGKSVRTAVRRLIHKGALRLIERSNLVHLVETDFMRTRDLRQAIHAREGGVCFYCLRQIPSRAHCLDHVVPQAAGGSNSYRNLVSCCLDCNPQKSNRPAEDFLRELYREGRLSPKDLSARLRALQDLAAGKLRPQL